MAITTPATLAGTLTIGTVHLLHQLPSFCAGFNGYMAEKLSCWKQQMHHTGPSPADSGWRCVLQVFHLKQHSQPSLIQLDALAIWQAQHAVVIKNCTCETQQQAASTTLHVSRCTPVHMCLGYDVQPGFESNLQSVLAIWQAQHAVVIKH
jgi:hypothetical protein